MYERMEDALIGALRAGESLKSGWRTTDDARARIGEWVIEAFVYGHIDEDDRLFVEFFEASPAELRGKSLSNIAWSFSRSKSVGAEIRDRFESLWDRRILHVQHAPDDRAELVGFFWLAKSVYHPVSWWLPRLLQALELEPSIATERYMIGKEIARAALEDPERSFQVTKRLLEQSPSGMVEHDLGRNAVPTVIARALDSGNSRLEADARDFMNKLGADGYHTLESEVHAVLDGRITINDVDD
ncbi:hypothetical protein DEI82_08295 [Curtobacterium sp. MCBD17_019]|nr:hypothetical protein DEI82_08295 [Curtobacterium sp. MCBD17_019]